MSFLRPGLAWLLIWLVAFAAPAQALQVLRAQEISKTSMKASLHPRSYPIGCSDPSGMIYRSETKAELLPSASGNGFTGLWFLTQTAGAGSAELILELKAQVRDSSGNYRDLPIYDSKTWVGNLGGRGRPKPIHQMDYGSVCAGATLSSVFIFANQDLVGMSEVVFRFDSILLQAGKAAISNIKSAAFDINITSNEPNTNILLTPHNN